MRASAAPAPPIGLSGGAGRGATATLGEARVVADELAGTVSADADADVAANPLAAAAVDAATGTARPSVENSGPVTTSGPMDAACCARRVI